MTFPVADIPVFRHPGLAAGCPNCSTGEA